MVMNRSEFLASLVAAAAAMAVAPQTLLPPAEVVSGVFHPADLVGMSLKDGSVQLLSNDLLGQPGDILVGFVTKTNPLEIQYQGKAGDDLRMPTWGDYLDGG